MPEHEVLLISNRFGACPPVLIIIFRLCLPETRSYIERDTVRHANGNLTGTFISEGRVALKRHWVLLVYLVLLMAGFNFMVHIQPYFAWRYYTDSCQVSWLSRLISDNVEESIQFFSKRRDSHSSSSEFRCDDWR